MEGDLEFPCALLAPMLAAAVKEMTNLRRFDLKSNAEGVMKHSSELSKALLSLRTLALTDVCAEACDTFAEAVAGDDGSLSHLHTLCLTLSIP